MVQCMYIKCVQCHQNYLQPPSQLGFSIIFIDISSSTQYRSFFGLQKAPRPTGHVANCLLCWKVVHSPRNCSYIACLTDTVSLLLDDNSLKQSWKSCKINLSSRRCWGIKTVIGNQIFIISFSNTKLLLLSKFLDCNWGRFLMKLIGYSPNRGLLVWMSNDIYILEYSWSCR